ncbi:MAG: alpha/beta hydrolase [Bacilli bacterium]
MKVTNKMISKDLRFFGRLHKLLSFPIPLKRSNKPIKNKKHRKTNKNKSTYNEYIKRKDGSELRLQVKIPQSRNNKYPCILWIHGGGYAIGMPEMNIISMANELKEKFIIVSCEYLLSTKKPYPAALEDCYLSLLWIKENVIKLGGRDDQIFVGGESAGGGLTAALCLYARDKGEVNIACQIPLYPMLDNIPSASMKDNNAPVWNEKKNIAAWKLYLDGKDDVSKYAVPARENDYSSLPPAITFVGSIDPFKDETITYVNNLTAKGIPVHFKVFEGCYHAFDMMVPWSKSAKEAKKFFNESVNYALLNYFSPQRNK